MNDERKTDPHELLQPEDDQDTPRDPRSPYEEMLEAAVINQRLADEYRAMLDESRSENAQLRIELGECKAMLLDATKQLKEASAHLQSASTTFLAAMADVKKACRACNPNPDEPAVRLSVVPT